MAGDTPDFETYHLTRIRTEAATGYFDCTPAEPLDFDTALERSRSRPNDEFLRKHLLRWIAGWEVDDLRRRIRVGDADALHAPAQVIVQDHIERAGHLRGTNPAVGLSV